MSVFANVIFPPLQGESKTRTAPRLRKASQFAFEQSSSEPPPDNPCRKHAESDSEEEEKEVAEERGDQSLISILFVFI